MNTRQLSLTFMILGLAAAVAPAQDAVRRLTQEEAVRSAVSKPQPEYPAIARQLKIQGRVEVEISIGASGSVENVKVLTGNPALTGTAVNTVKRWRFEPITAEGKPIRAMAVMSFNFKL